MVPLTDVTRRDGIHVVRLHGELDISKVDAIARALDALTHDGQPEAVVDLSDVPFVDCATVGILATSAGAASDRGGRLVVACPQPGVARVLALTKYSASWPVCATVEDAIDVARPTVVKRAATPGPDEARVGPQPNGLIRCLPAWLARHIAGAA